ISFIRSSIPVLISRGQARMFELKLFRSPAALRFWTNPGALIGTFILVCVLALVVAAPIVYPDGPFEMVDRPFLPPFGEYLFGTDMLGRDIAAGIAYGARISLLVGLVATLVIVVLGTAVGAVAGYYGGWVDTFAMRVTEFFQTIPTFIGAIVIVAVLGPPLPNVIGAI